MRPPKGGNIKSGICRNNEYLNPDNGEIGPCPKCASGEIQRVNVQRLSDFKCSECGAKLEPVKGGLPKWLIPVCVAGVLAIGGGGALIYNQMSEPATENPGGGPTGDTEEETDSTTTETDSCGVDSTTTPPKQDPPKPQPLPVFGGAAVLSADRTTITFNRDYVLDLHTNDGEELYISRGDKIRGVKIENGRLLSGEYFTPTGEARYLSGLNNRL